jgi:hypothetical protein
VRNYEKSAIPKRQKSVKGKQIFPKGNKPFLAKYTNGTNALMFLTKVWKYLLSSNAGVGRDM